MKIRENEISSTMAFLNCITLKITHVMLLVIVASIHCQFSSNAINILSVIYPLGCQCPVLCGGHPVTLFLHVFVDSHIFAYFFNIDFTCHCRSVYFLTSFFSELVFSHPRDGYENAEIVAYFQCLQYSRVAWLTQCSIASF